jgi:hypothetical protein
MAFKPSRPQGPTRISESEEARTIAPQSTESSSKLGKFCLACSKYYSYLRPHDKLCVSCDSRKSLLK